MGLTAPLLKVSLA